MAVLRHNKKPTPPRYKPDKQKGTPAAFSGFGPVRINAAYKELSHPGFAVWLRLLVAEDSELKAGRSEVACMLDKSRRSSNRVLLELSRKGYISFIHNGFGRPTEVVIERRVIIPNRGFVRI